MDKSFAQICKSKDAYWMKRSRTAFPSALNYTITDIVRLDDEIVLSIFTSHS